MIEIAASEALADLVGHHFLLLSAMFALPSTTLADFEGHGIPESAFL